MANQSTASRNKNSHNDESSNQVANRAGNGTKPESTVEVLYQKMGDRWFAFSLIEDQVFVGSISQDEIDAADAKGGAMYKVTGNS